MKTSEGRRFWALFGVLWLVCVSISRAEENLPTIMELQRAYVEANGGLSNMQDLSSLIASGHIENAAGEQSRFKLYRKRPDLMRMQIESGATTQTTVFDGREAFRILSRRGELKDTVKELSEEKAEELRADSSMEGPFFQLRSRPERLKVVAETEIDGVAAYEIEIAEHASHAYSHIWLSQENFQELKLRRAVTADSGEAVVEEIYFGDFEKVRGVWLARKVRYERGGAFTHQVQIDRVRANVGIFDSYFAKPKS